MTLWQRWVHRPQTVLFRKAMFQVHLWLGIGIAAYVVLMSVSGSAIVFRHELLDKYARPTPTVAVSGPRMTEQQLSRVAQKLYPGYVVERIEMSDRQDGTATLVLQRGSEEIPRLFNPYTGEDMGNPEWLLERSIYWLADLHDDLLADETGRTINGIAAILIILLTVSGVVVWWPGIRTWRRAIGFSWQRGGFVRLNWDLHSVLGLWFTVFLLIWGVSAIYLCFPQFFSGVSDDALVALSDIHFGRINYYTKVSWTVFGLVPAILTVTGAVMWWFRVVVPFLRRRLVRVPQQTANEAVSQD